MNGQPSRCQRAPILRAQVEELLAVGRAAGREQFTRRTPTEVKESRPALRPIDDRPPLDGGAAAAARHQAVGQIDVGCGGRAAPGQHDSAAANRRSAAAQFGAGEAGDRIGELGGALRLAKAPAMAQFQTVQAINGKLRGRDRNSDLRARRQVAEIEVVAGGVAGQVDPEHGAGEAACGQRQRRRVELTQRVVVLRLDKRRRRRQGQAHPVFRAASIIQADPHIIGARLGQGRCPLGKATRPGTEAAEVGADAVVEIVAATGIAGTIGRLRADEQPVQSPGAEGEPVHIRVRGQVTAEGTVAHIGDGTIIGQGFVRIASPDLQPVQIVGSGDQVRASIAIEIRPGDAAGVIGFIVAHRR